MLANATVASLTNTLDQHFISHPCHCSAAKISQKSFCLHCNLLTSSIPESLGCKSANRSPSSKNACGFTVAIRWTSPLTHFSCFTTSGSRHWAWTSASFKMDLLGDQPFAHDVSFCRQEAFKHTFCAAGIDPCGGSSDFSDIPGRYIEVTGRIGPRGAASSRSDTYSCGLSPWAPPSEHCGPDMALVHLAEISLHVFLPIST